MSGSQLAESIKEVCPGLKVLYVSGYTADALRRHGVEDASKPFPPEQLAQRVREVLDSPSGRP